MGLESVPGSDHSPAPRYRQMAAWAPADVASSGEDAVAVAGNGVVAAVIRPPGFAIKGIRLGTAQAQAQAQGQH